MLPNYRVKMRIRTIKAQYAYFIIVKTASIDIYIYACPDRTARFCGNKPLTVKISYVQGAILN